MNYLFLGGRFSLNYAYVDLNTDTDYVADSLFFRHKVPVFFGDEMVSDGDKYRVVFCKVKRKYREEFEKALKELPNKMSLLGHNDYESFCDSLMNLLDLPQAT